MTPIATTTITPTSTTTTPPAKIPALMSINTNLPPRFRRSSPCTSSITTPLSPIISLHPSSPRLYRNSNNRDSVGSTPTIPTKTKRSYHHLLILEHQHHNNKYNADNNNYDKIKNTYSATYTQERSTSPSSNRSGIQYHQLSRILFFSKPFQPNYFCLLKTTKCGILPNYRIANFSQNLPIFLVCP